MEIYEDPTIKVDGANSPTLSECIRDWEKEQKETEEEFSKCDYRHPKFQCINFPGWEKWWDANTDMYGKACILFAHDLAYKLDCEILKHSEEGFSYIDRDLYKKIFSEIDEEIGGITRFQFGFIKRILEDCWRFGKEWGNTEWI